MALSPQQLATLKAAILAESDPAFVAARNEGNNTVMAEFFNATASPLFYVYKDSLSRHAILAETSDDGTVFGWTGNLYISRAQGERDAFREMFNSTGAVDPSLATIRAAFNDIFSGAGGLPNRTHIEAMSRRTVNKFERLFVTGTGSKVDPGKAIVVGNCTRDDILAAMEN